MVITLDVQRVLDWRSRQQLLHRPAEARDPVAVVRRLLGVQAQVGGYAEQAVAARQRRPDPAGVRAAVADGRLVKTWAARGTLHLLDVAQAPAHLALLAATRNWEKGSWQKTYVTVAQLGKLGEAVGDALGKGAVSREALVTAVLERTGDKTLTGHLESGWGTVLKPLAWQGLLMYGPSDGQRITFTKPPWTALPEVDDAARELVPAYLQTYGPATPDRFDQWLSRGASKRAVLKGWFAGLAADGVLTEVDVDGARMFARTEDVGALEAAEPFPDVRLLPAFDQFVLAPGTAETMIIPKDKRASVSRAAGWISPVVAHRGRVAGTWQRADGDVELDLWSADVPQAGLDAEIQRLLQ